MSLQFDSTIESFVIRSAKHGLNLDTLRECIRRSGWTKDVDLCMAILSDSLRRSVFPPMLQKEYVDSLHFVCLMPEEISVDPDELLCCKLLASYILLKQWHDGNRAVVDLHKGTLLAVLVLSSISMGPSCLLASYLLVCHISDQHREWTTSFVRSMALLLAALTQSDLASYGGQMERVDEAEESEISNGLWQRAFANINSQEKMKFDFLFN